MNSEDEVFFLGRLTSLLARHDTLTFGEIKDKTKSFIKKKRQTDSSLFDTLEKFVSSGQLKRELRRGHICYKLNLAQFETGLITSETVTAEVERSHIEAPNVKLPSTLEKYAKQATELAAKPPGQRYEEGLNCPNTEEIANNMLKSAKEEAKKYNPNFTVDLSASEDPEKDFS